MKTLKRTMLVFGVMLMSFSVLDANDPSATTTCSSNGCNVVVTQTPTDWTMTIDCGDGGHDSQGSGQYGGTICNGVAPATFITP